MLSFDIRSLASKAVHVEGAVAADDPVWEAGDARPINAVNVSGRLSAAGSGRYYFSGHIHGEAATECRRCLTHLQVPVDEDVQFLFVEADTEGAADPDVYVVDPRARELDLRPAVREQWVLAVPAFAQCRDDCQGLCPTCGADLNADPCDCRQVADSRWGALRDIQGKSG